MSRPLINDKSHDPFIIFGGLYSRSVVFNQLSKFQGSSGLADMLSQYQTSISASCPNEDILRKRIASLLLSTKTVSLPVNSVRDIIYDDVVIEVKNAVQNWNLDSIRGSKKVASGHRYETAEEELFRYLNEDKSHANWGVLTNGRQFRFYNSSNSDYFIEFDVFDIALAGAEPHAKLFFELLHSPILRREIWDATKKIQEHQAEIDLESRLLKFLHETRLIRNNALKCGLFFLMIRYLEDIGILPIQLGDYQKYSLRDPKNYSSDNLKTIADKFVTGKWFNGHEQISFRDELSEIKQAVEKSQVCSALKTMLVSPNGDVFDLSDIYIDHLGNIYQKFVSKHAEGAHYTPPSVGFKLAEYLSTLNHSKRQEFSEDKDQVMVDPACGSGQLLRAIVPYAHQFYDHNREYIPKNSMRRNLISRMVGVDCDPLSVFLCKMGLCLMGAESKDGLAEPKKVLCEDTLEAFVDSRRNFHGIERKKIFAIITNPPWESLDFQEQVIYRKLTGKGIPKKSSLNNGTPEKRREAKRAYDEYLKWLDENKESLDEERNRNDRLKRLCDDIANEHKEFFSGKKNIALYFMFVVTKLLESSNGCYLVVLPDRFLVGDETPLRDLLMPEFEAYAPFQNCGSIFEGVDKGTRFGIVFGRKGKSTPKLRVDIPIIENDVPVDFVTMKLSKSDLCVSDALLAEFKQYILPFFKSPDDPAILNAWIANREKLENWQRGLINLGKKGEGNWGKVGNGSEYTYKVTKSEQRTTSGESEFLGVFQLPLGASVEILPERLKNHHKQAKAIIPNVKRNGVRKVLVGFGKNCLVETDYNFNPTLTEKDSVWLRSLTYNHLVNMLGGSYHVNAALLNFLGKPSLDDVVGDSFAVCEVGLLTQIGFSKVNAVRLVSSILLEEYPNSFAESCVTKIKAKYPKEYGEVFKSQIDDIQGDIHKIADLATRRAAIATYLVHSHKDEQKFGRVKLEKLLFLFEGAGVVELNGNYKRKAAGPLDQDALYNKRSGIEAVAARANFFTSEVRVSKGKERVIYKLGTHSDQALSLAKGAFNGSLKEAQRLVAIFKKATTEQSEIAATLFAAWNDLLISGHNPTDNDVIQEVRKNWHQSKSRFSEQRLQIAINWMRKVNLVPRGQGPKTRK